MQVTTRRAALAGSAMLVAGAATLAAVITTRKPTDPPIATLQPQSNPRLEPFHPILSNPPAPPPPAGFTDAAGTATNLDAFRGQGLVVNLWATWCAPCVAEMPALQRLATLLANDRITILPLASDRGGAPVVQAFYAVHAITLPIWLDPKAALASAWQARGLPTTLIIDRQGREQARLEGAVDWTALETMEKIRKLVG